MKLKYKYSYITRVCILLVLSQSTIAQPQTGITGNLAYTYNKPGKLYTGYNFSVNKSDSNYNKEAASFLYNRGRAITSYKRKKYTFDDYKKLAILKASFDIAKTKYKNDYYKRKAVEKADFEMILLLTPDIFPNPFDVNKSDNPVEQDEATTAKSRSFFSFRTGLRFSARGDKQVADDATYTTYIYYLALPVYALYNYQSSSGVFFGGLGPYYGYGLFGKYIDKVSGVSTKEKIKFGENESGLRHGDFGLGLVAGYVYKRILFQLSYDFGLSNIYFGSIDKAYNRAFGISVGYILN